MKSALLLLSGGIDSPVVGHILKNKGFHVRAVHFYARDFIGEGSLSKVKALAKKIGVLLDIVDISPILAEIKKKSDERYFFVLLKRVMYKLSEKLAIKKGISFIATGDNLGQVSSQTLQNLSVINNSISMPVLRPLIAYDKMEIVDVAKKIGTFEMSNGEEICALLGPKHPLTQSYETSISGQEKKIGLDKLINKIDL